MRERGRLHACLTPLLTPLARQALSLSNHFHNFSRHLAFAPPVSTYRLIKVNYQFVGTIKWCWPVLSGLRRAAGKCERLSRARRCRLAVAERSN